jgi:hypothetical protein
MTVIYKIDTDKYEPNSHGSNYLYDQFDRIQSFLNKQNNALYNNLLAKPVLSNNQVLWYANFSQPFSRITELSQQEQIDIKAKYWEVRQLIDNEIQKLSLSKDAEKQNWGNLLKDVFNEDDNVILSDGKDWCLLWGWKFRNNKENYLAPEFMPKISAANAEMPTGSVENNAPTPIVTQTNVPIIAEPERVHIVEDAALRAARVKPTFWDRIKRFLRTLVYRIWGLLLLIMFILFLACLFKKCQNDKMEKSCSEMEQLNRKLIDVEKKVQDRCNDKK